MNSASTPAEPNVATQKRQIFARRLLSTIAMWGVSLWCIFSGNEWAFFALISTLSLAGLWEYFTMLDHKKLPNFKLTAAICGALFLICSFYRFRTYGPSQSDDFEIAVILLFLLGVFARQMFERTRDRSPLETMVYTLFGLLYVVWLFSFLLKIVYLAPRTPDGHVTGHFYVLYLIAITKFSDMGAYLVGSLIGRHKMIPHISPNKTWEGFGGAIAFSLLASFALLWLMPGKLSALTPMHAAILGVVLCLVAIVGDLGESIIKRSTDVKDSGQILPGIGGALDLIDSLLFTGPLLYFYMRWVLGMG